MAADETRIIGPQYSQSRPAGLATFAMAQALITQPLPWREQNPDCSRIRLIMTVISALCIWERTADMGSPVTTIERVGRTIGGKRFDLGDIAMMNNGLSHGSATIYQFPVGGRAALGGRRYGETRLPADQLTLPVSDCSGSWYHQEAVDEAKPKWDR